MTMKKFKFVGQMLLLAIFTWAMIVIGFTSDLSLNTAWGQKPERVSESKVQNIHDGRRQTYIQGHNGEMSIRIRVSEGKIREVEVLEHKETKGVGTTAVEQIPLRIIEKNSTEDIEIVSGATVSSNAILSAVDQMLREDLD